MTEAIDKITACRIAMISAMFAFRENYTLMLEEMRLRFLEMISDGSISSQMKSFFSLTNTTNNQQKINLSGFRKLWTSQNTVKTYKCIVFEIIQIYHILTTQLPCLVSISNYTYTYINNNNHSMITHNQFNVNKCIQISNNDQNNIESINCCNHSNNKNNHKTEEIKENNDENNEISDKNCQTNHKISHNQMQLHCEFMHSHSQKSNIKSPFQSGSWLIVGLIFYFNFYFFWCVLCLVYLCCNYSIPSFV